MGRGGTVEGWRRAALYDGDGDGLDLHTLIDSFASGSGEGDINGDGKVNSSDLLLFLNNFGCNDCAK